jgi:hypothetical protein
MDVHKEFTEWAVARGVKINGIAAHRFPRRGLGIIAEKKFKASGKFLLVCLFVCCLIIPIVIRVEFITINKYVNKSFKHTVDFSQVKKNSTKASDDDTTYHQNREEDDSSLGA